MSKQDHYMQLPDKSGDENNDTPCKSQIILSGNYDSYNQTQSNVFSNPLASHGSTVFDDILSHMHDERIAKWKIYCSYKIIFCLIFLLFSTASVSVGQSFRSFEKANDPKICSESSLHGDTQETNSFGDCCIVALLLSLIVSCWCYGSYIKYNFLIFKDPNLKMSISNIQLYKKSQKKDILAIMVVFVVLTIGISVLGTDISKDIMNIEVDCDIELYPFDTAKAKAITDGFMILHVTYWVSITLTLIYVAVTREILTRFSRLSYINAINARFCC